MEMVEIVWTQDEEGEGPSMPVTNRRSTASAVIRIVNTERGTWQGTVEDVLSGEKGTFRGCLAMLRLIARTFASATDAEVGTGMKIVQPTGARKWAPFDASDETHSMSI